MLGRDIRESLIIALVIYMLNVPCTCSVFGTETEIQRRGPWASICAPVYLI